MTSPVKLACLATLMALFAGCASAPAKRPGGPPPVADYRVIDGGCESGRARVNALTIAVKTPGVIELEWDNDLLCGKPA